MEAQSPLYPDSKSDDGRKKKMAKYVCESRVEAKRSSWESRIAHSDRDEKSGKETEKEREKEEAQEAGAKPDASNDGRWMSWSTVGEKVPTKENAGLGRRGGIEQGEDVILAGLGGNIRGTAKWEERETKERGVSAEAMQRIMPMKCTKRGADRRNAETQKHEPLQWRIAERQSPPMVDVGPMLVG
ncbi:hypothetical protein AOQ84DRAFT_363156 [Glonium stellatum]|uniref:Uncharacterized protein n=1 Tax=Glonium stellatum TaxID=574774 RepID=A0A8E2F2X4_9PEZI|nr:hypothetical protein AOQ84DRAFT_363156 [Glonium stellatum]